ncbi:MAG TPA: hypothetical protein PLB81_02630, partial [Deltaproteobacteria bacterium]|nr:hypothetical protein [Deltaproteobacteria bacterium]
SSGGMEAAIWTANHCAELIAQDKLNKTVKFNVEFNPEPGFMPLMKALPKAGMAVAAIAAFKALKRVCLR